MTDIFYSMSSITIQLNKEQLNWIIEKSIEKAKKDNKSPSRAEIVRMTVQKAIEDKMVV